MIRTCRTDKASVIVVEDNGPGFDAAQRSEAHTALTNIRQRLELMCDGKMEITAREEGGTRVTIRIPLRGTQGD
jgi:signal transduction histidine kinase